jgi:hypothetical protein
VSSSVVVIFDARTYTASKEAIRMKRLPIRGASLMTPALSEEDLKDVLGKLGAVEAFNDAKVLARQRNNYERPGYGNAPGYAEASRNGPQRLFSNW